MCQARNSLFFSRLETASPERFVKDIRGCIAILYSSWAVYFGISSWANLLATTSRMPVRFFPASIIASREP